MSAPSILETPAETALTGSAGPRPCDHPEFFTRPPPEGRSRESHIALSAEGTFQHDGALVEHPRLAAAMHTWIDRHPLDGRYILNNGYDWTYFTVDDAPYYVRSVIDDGEGFPLLVLSDGTTEPLRGPLEVGPSGAALVTVKSAARRGPYSARFLRHAQSELAPYLLESADAAISLRTRDGAIALPS